MPLRTDPRLWYNLPGVVAAYQPIGAPGPLLARYNMAHGGDNRYAVTESGAGPTWGQFGWRFVGASSQKLATPIVIDSGAWTMIVAFANGSLSGGEATGLMGNQGRFDLLSNWFNLGAYYRNGNASNTAVSPSLSSGVVGLTKSAGYRNGVLDATLAADGQTYSAALSIGRANTFYGTVDVKACLVCFGTLSPQQIWYASRQMAYCHVNPDWSAWGRRRRWYVLAPIIETSPPNSVLGGSFGVASFPAAPRGGLASVVRRPNAPISGQRGFRK